MRTIFTRTRANCFDRSKYEWSLRFSGFGQARGGGAGGGSGSVAVSAAQRGSLGRAAQSNTVSGAAVGGIAGSAVATPFTLSHRHLPPGESLAVFVCCGVVDRATSASICGGDFTSQHETGFAVREEPLPNPSPKKGGASDSFSPSLFRGGDGEGFFASGVLQQHPVNTLSTGAHAQDAGAQPTEGSDFGRIAAPTGNATTGVNWPNSAVTAIASRSVVERANTALP